ncbi:MAG TPA: hypothetical protein VHF51_19250 [Solirubrobacteraceae bacterium]|nr:hypothetical protein [Solirubrobacteraceae bacterium]
MAGKATIRGAGQRTEPAHGDPWDALSRELDRSRRYRHALTLVRVSPDESSGHRSLAARLRREGRPGDPLRRLEAELSASVRAGDCAWSDDGAVFVLLPETDAAGAEAMLARMRAGSPALAAGSDVALATFPEHGVTGRALRAAVTHRDRRHVPAGPGREWRVLPDLPAHPAHPPGAVPGGAD